MRLRRTPPPPPAVVKAPPPPRPTLLQRIRAALRTTTGRLALIAGSLALALLLLLIMRPMQTAIPLPDQPALVNQPAASPIGGIAAAIDIGGCIWNGYQPVAKRWDEVQKVWVSVGVDGTASGTPPEVVVTLEQVAYCSNKITMTWSVLNNGKRAVELPLRNDNISIHDVLGNLYPLNDAGSKPSTLQVAPGEQASGTVVVLRPLSQNASSLLIRLKKQPFGEASWLVSLNR